MSQEVLKKFYASLKKTISEKQSKVIALFQNLPEKLQGMLNTLFFLALLNIEMSTLSYHSHCVYSNLYGVLLRAQLDARKTTGVFSEVPLSCFTVIFDD